MYEACINRAEYFTVFVITAILLCVYHFNNLHTIRTGRRGERAREVRSDMNFTVIFICLMSELLRKSTNKLKGNSTDFTSNMDSSQTFLKII